MIGKEIMVVLNICYVELNILICINLFVIINLLYFNNLIKIFMIINRYLLF